MVSETTNSSTEVGSSDYDGLIDGSAPAESFNGATEAILEQAGIDHGVSVFLTAELPPHTGIGAGTGSAIALIWALARMRGKPITATEAGRVAALVEAERLGLPFGVSDAYAQAVGGLTFVDIQESKVCASPIAISADLSLALQARLMLFYTGRTNRDTLSVGEASKAAERNRAGVIEALHEIRSVAIDLRDRLEGGEIDQVGPCLDRTWKATRRMGPAMSDPWVDQWYAMALNAGATGGKLNGLGYAGFLLLYCEPDRQASVTESLKSAGLRRIGVQFESTGVALIADDGTSPTTAHARSLAGHASH